MKKSFIYPIIFMSLLTAFFTFILAFLDYSTAERVAFLQDTELKQKVLYVFDIEVESTEPEEIDRIFQENIEEEIKDGDRYFHLMKDGQTVAYGVPVGGPGLWGSVEAYVGISADYRTLMGLDFTSHSETPGLGGRISEDDFKEQFRGLNLEDVKDKEYIIYRPANGGNVDAIAGATLTSKSVSKFLNEDIDKFIKERKGE